MLLLVTTSPRRVEVLSVLGAPFESVAPDLDERAFASPALAKAEAVAYESWTDSLRCMDAGWTAR